MRCIHHHLVSVIWFMRATLPFSFALIRRCTCIRKSDEETKYTAPIVPCRVGGSRPRTQLYVNSCSIVLHAPIQGHQDALRSPRLYRTGLRQNHWHSGRALTASSRALTREAQGAAPHPANLPSVKLRLIDVNKHDDEHRVRRLPSVLGERKECGIVCANAPPGRPRLPQRPLRRCREWPPARILSYREKICKRSI